MTETYKDVLTTTQIAVACRVAPRTVTKWIDKGLLKGYRIPGGKDRRVLRSDLMEFLQKNKMPFEGIDMVRYRALAICMDRPQAQKVKEGLGEDFSFRLAEDAYSAGLISADYKPTHVIVDLGMGRREACVVARRVREQFPDAFVLALAYDDETDPNGLLAAGFNHVRRGFVADSIVAVLKSDLTSRSRPA